MSKEVVVLSAARSAIGAFGGSLSTMEPAELAGLVMKETEARTKGFFAGLAVIGREWMEKFSGSFNRVRGNDQGDGHGGRGRVGGHR